MKLALLVLLTASVARAEVRTEVRTVVDRWVAAQNQGDFATYQTLYADKMRGIRRSGSREVRLQRAGWMKDRRRMFDKSMRVGVANIAIHVSEAVAQVSFEQSFAQGTYSDTSKKVLVLVRENGAWKITNEELRTSAMGAKTESNGSLVGLFDGLGIVLAEADPTWIAKGLPTLDVMGGRNTVLRPVDLAKLPPELRSRDKSVVELLDRSGTVCRSTIERLRASRSVIQDFVREDEAGHLRQLAKAEIAAEMLASTDDDDDKLLALVHSDCKDPLVARTAHATAPVAIARAADAAEEKRALAKIQTLPAYRAVRDRWRAEAPQEFATQKPNEEWPDRREVRTFDVTVEGKAQHWVSLHVARGDDCSSWAGFLWALWRVDGATWTLLDEPGEIAIYPELAVDLDGDGWPELVYTVSNTTSHVVRGILWREGRVYRRTQETKIAFHGCGC